jgi:hypothetical protein
MVWERGATVAEGGVTVVGPWGHALRAWGHARGPALGERDSMLAERRIDLRIDPSFLYAARRLTPKRS